MKQYIGITRNILENGELKGNRTGIRAKTTFCEIFRHQMSEGFPLLTTKKMYMHAVAVELEGFIKGITDKEWYQEQRCRIWNEWGNPEQVEVMKGKLQEAHPTQEEYPTKAVQEMCNDLGPIYGYQWRGFNLPYENGLTVKEAADQQDEPYDQFNTIVQRLKNNPDDRRMVVSAWNPLQISQMALPPCHYAFTLVHINGVLNLSWKQRSCDLMLGVPFNIASYALLLELLCKESGLIAGELVGVLEDCHIYEDKIDGAYEQIQREPKQLPTITINDTELASYSSMIKDGFDIFNWSHKDFFLHNYKSHEKIDFGKVAV